MCKMKQKNAALEFLYSRQRISIQRKSAILQVLPLFIVGAFPLCKKIQ